MVDIIDEKMQRRLEDLQKTLKKAREDDWSLKGGLGDIRDARF